jgi:hypothetical protein
MNLTSIRHERPCMSILRLWPSRCCPRDVPAERLYRLDFAEGKAPEPVGTRIRAATYRLLPLNFACFRLLPLRSGKVLFPCFVGVPADCAAATNVTAGCWFGFIRFFMGAVQCEPAVVFDCDGQAVKAIQMLCFQNITIDTLSGRRLSSCHSRCHATRWVAICRLDFKDDE